MRWSELNDYIYVPGATNQRLMASDMFRRSQHELLILGYEQHYENDVYVEDPHFSTYIYDERTNILTKVADNLREAIEEHVAENFDRDLVLLPTAVIKITGIVREYIYDMVVVYIQGNGISSDSVDVYNCTFFLNATPDGYKVLWDTYTSGFYIETEKDSICSVDCFCFSIMVKLPTDTVLAHSKLYTYSSFLDINLSADYLYQNTGAKIRIKGIAGWTEYKYLHRPLSFHTYYKITPFGIEPYLEEVTETIPVYNENTNTYDINARHMRRIYSFIRYLGGTRLFSECRVKEEIEDYKAIFTVTRLLRDPYGLVLDTETGGLEIEASHSCPDPSIYGYIDETYYMSEYLTPYKKISAFDRYANNLYYTNVFSGGPPGNKCNDPLWRSYTPPPGWFWAGPFGRFYIWNTGLVFSIYYTNFPDDVFGHVTFLGADRAWLPFVEKSTTLAAPTQGIIGYALQDNIYVMTPIDGVKKLNWRLGIQAKPSSITTFEGLSNKYLTIGGRTDYPRELDDAIFFQDGVQVPAEAVLQHYTNSALYVRVNIPNLTSSGVLNTETRIDIVSYSGESLVKHYEDGTLLHGSILPYRLRYIVPYSGYTDLSFNLPSEISTSVDFMGDTIHISMGNKVYKLVNSGWQEVFTTTPITTALITEDNFIFVGHSGINPSVHRYLSSVEQADFGLPDNLVVLDLEEEHYADR